MMTRPLILALSLAISVAPAAAQAGNNVAAVHIDDLDLTQATDREQLDLRLKNAARNVCYTRLRGVAERIRQSECMSDALAGAKPHAERAIAQAQGGTRLALLMVQASR
ncbi:UrcA family protein [Sphingopyxis fribergensis]